VPNVSTCANDCVLPDFCAGFDDGVRLDRYSLSDLGTRIDNRAWMNSRRECNRLGRQLEHKLLEGLGWICDANLSGGDGLGKIRWNEDRRGARFAQESNILSVRKKADLSGRRFRERCSARDF
jgi:hypothetical protein